MLDEKDLTQIRDYVIRMLPEILREEPQIAATIEGILAQHFPRRDEFARLLDELTQLREDMNQRFEQSREETNRQFELLREEMNQRFEQVDRRFELLREEMDRRFEQVDRRFELLREEMDRRFEEAHQTQLDMKRDIIQVRHGQEMLLERFDGQEKWLWLFIGGLHREKGRDLENMFAAALRYGLNNPEIKAEHIRLRQKLVDQEGHFFKPGLVTEVDLIAKDNKLIVFEVKRAATVDDVDHFANKVELVAIQHPDQPVQGVLITLEAQDDVRQRCAVYGLELVA